MKKITDIMKKNRILLCLILVFVITFAFKYGVNNTIFATEDVVSGENEGVESEPTLNDTETPEETPENEPVVDVTEEPDVEETASPTEIATIEPTSEPTTEPTVEPTAEPTEKPTVKPTAKPTPKPTEKPKTTPTKNPSETSNVTSAPTPNQGATDATNIPTNIPTNMVTIEPTPVSPTPNYLPDFTIPPAEYEGSEEVNKEETGAQESEASAGIVDIEDIEAEKEFQIYDLIKYAAFMFFGLAALSAVYGLVCVVGLLFFNKDLSFGAIRKRRKAEKKEEENKEK